MNEEASFLPIVEFRRASAPFVWELFIDGQYMGDLHPTERGVQWITKLARHPIRMEEK